MNSHKKTNQGNLATRMLVFLSFILIAGIASAGRFAVSPSDQIIDGTSSSTPYTYPEYDSGWSTNDCADYSFSGLNEAYGRYADCSTGNQGYNKGWVDDDKETQPDSDCKYEGADCSAFVGRCWALPGFVPENVQKGHGRSTYQIYRGGYLDKNDVKRSHRVDESASTVVAELLQCKQWDIFVVNSDAANSLGITQADGTPCTTVNHTGLIRSVSTSNSDVNTRDAVVPKISNVTRPRSYLIDRCSRFYRRDNWANIIMPPVISAQPQSRTNNIGDNARFIVSATGTNLTYQWRKNGGNISGATNAQLDFLITNAFNAGAFSVVVSNLSLSVTSATATLTIRHADRTKLAQWNFNSATADGNISTGTSNPSFGSGAFNVVGGLIADYNIGSPSDSASTGTDNSSRRFSGGFPASGGSDKSVGWRINFSTVGYTNIVVTWEQQNQADASKYNRLQYTTNGATWINHTVHAMTLGSVHVYHSSDLSGIPGLHDNANVGIRVLTEWESTATGAGATGFVGTTAGYSSSGDMYYDVITVMGTSIPTPPPPVNQPPMLAPINNRIVHAGSTLVFTNFAFDPNPGNTLTFSLDAGAPSGAAIHPATGRFAWNTGDAEANTTLFVCVRATDDGQPPLSGTATFNVEVRSRPSIESSSISANTGALTWSAIPGVTYRIEYKNDLDEPNWQALSPDVTANDFTATIDDSNFGGNSQRFYRIRLVD